jgi:hypothetical protein
MRYSAIVQTLILYGCGQLKKNTQVSHVITQALSLVRVTHLLPSNHFAYHSVQLVQTG